MDFSRIFKKNPVRTQEDGTEKAGREDRHPEVPDGLLIRCTKCRKGSLAEDYQNHQYICPKCGGYQRMPAQDRIRMLADDTFEEWDTGLPGHNPLHLKGYPDRITALQEQTGLDEAVVTGSARIGAHRTVLMVMDSRFLTGSMGEVVGEKIARGVDRATQERLPVILVCCSGGARMQEGIHSLMQMARTAAAIRRHSDAGLLCVTVLTDPTMGGVTASFAMLGDIILAEPGALIGFAGPRVIEQTIRQKLPKGFQRSEFLLEHGFLDAIVTREHMRDTLEQILTLHAQPQQASDIQAETEVQQASGTVVQTNAPHASGIVEQMDAPHAPGTLDQMDLQQISLRRKQKNAWERVQLARKKGRPVASDYIERLFDSFLELHGDRCYGDDPAICGGVAFFQGRPVTVIAQMKGKDTKENIRRNFAMPRPEGYRKAVRLMKQAEKFHRPVICLVDTPGAYCGAEAEERGQGEAIARCIYEMSALNTPKLSILIGEGGSGGALALAVADEVWAMENAVYSVLSPEGFASILWKDAGQAEKAARVMGLTSYDLYRQGIIRQIFMEPESYQADTMGPVCAQLGRQICNFLNHNKK